MSHSFSDHRYLRYGIESNAIKATPTRNPRKADWRKFANLVQSKVKTHKRSKIISSTVLDEEVNCFSSILNQSYKTACPHRYCEIDTARIAKS